MVDWWFTRLTQPNNCQQTLSAYAKGEEILGNYFWPLGDLFYEFFVWSLSCTLYSFTSSEFMRNLMIQSYKASKTTKKSPSERKMYYVLHFSWSYMQSCSKLTL